MFINLSEFQPTPHLTVSPNNEHPNFRYCNGISLIYFLTKIPYHVRVFALLSVHIFPLGSLYPSRSSELNESASFLHYVMFLNRSFVPVKYKYFSLKKICTGFFVSYSKGHNVSHTLVYPD